MAAVTTLLSPANQVSQTGLGSSLSGTGQRGKYVINYTDAIKATAATNDTINFVLDYLPQGTIITATRIKTTAQWTGASIAWTAKIYPATNTGTTSVPVASLGTAYGSVALPLSTAIATPAVEDTGIDTDITGGPLVYGTIGMVCCVLVATGAASTALTGGQLECSFDYIVLG